MMERIKVMVIDDSAVVRQVLTTIVKSDRRLELIAAASDPLFAERHMEQCWPDVIILDIEMPRMDGLTFLRKLMAERPTPVVICSTLTTEGAQTTMDALAAGAVGIIAKPKVDVRGQLTDEATMLLDAVRSAAGAKLARIAAAVPARPVDPRRGADSVLPPPATRPLGVTTERVVAIGTSTGGTQALEALLTALPRVSPGIVIVQHMPEKFTAAFAARLDGISALEVREARHRDRVLPGRALIAPGGRHMMLRRSGAQYHVEVVDGPLVSRHRPSVDVLFRSVARAAGANALGVIMTGMGDDGAAGLAEMHSAGAQTLAQDEASCVVFGMPKEAIRRGAVDAVCALHDIPNRIMEFVEPAAS